MKKTRKPNILFIDVSDHGEMAGEKGAWQKTVLEHIKDLIIII